MMLLPCALHGAQISWPIEHVDIAQQAYMHAIAASIRVQVLDKYNLKFDGATS